MSNSIKKGITVYTEFDGVIIENHFTDLFSIFTDSNIANLFSEQNISNIIEKYYIDANFKVFTDYCRNFNIELNVVSDGFLELINPIFQREGIININCYANSLVYSENYLDVHVYGASESCICKDLYINDEDSIKRFLNEKKSCKRNTILANCEPENILVYIGDGFYDTCMADYSDIIFAKDKLSAYCNKYRIPHYNYKNFFDIYRILKDLFENKKYKIRHQAYLNRRRAFENE